MKGVLDGKRKGTHRRAPDVILGQTGGGKTVVASRTTESLIDSFLNLNCKVVGNIVTINSVDELT